MFKRKLLEELNDYFKNDSVLPVILYGARQVGKTTLMKNIYIEKKIYIDLENNHRFAEFVKDATIEEIISYIEIEYMCDLDSNTLLIFDEVQVSPRIITMLKYFYDANKNYKVIASGSYLSTTTTSYSFPVGRVEIKTVFPLDFSEFLVATNKTKLLDVLKETFKKRQIKDIFHEMLLEEFNNYLVVGGMPEAINKYNFGGINNVKLYHELYISNFKEDITKYEVSVNKIKLLNLFEKVNVFIGKSNQKFVASYVETGSSIASWYEYIKILELNKIIIKANTISSLTKPLNQNINDRKFKLFYHDTSLLVHFNNYYNIDKYIDEDKIYLGMLCENYAAIVISKYCNVYCYQDNTKEIDFVFEDEIIPVEIKASKNTKAKSLDILIDKNSLNKAYVVSTNDYLVCDVKEYIPIYAFHLLVEEMHK